MLKLDNEVNDIISEQNNLICRICGEKSLFKLDVGSLLFSPVSYAPDFHEYENFVCLSCGVVSGQPEPGETELIDHYNNVYRESELAFKADDKTIDTLINFRSSGRSFQRAKTFYSVLHSVKTSHPGAQILPTDTIIDFGAYQGMFLSAVARIWGCNCVATDYSKSGISFAKHTLGFKDSWVTKDIYTDRYKEKVRFVTMIHVLEHLREPVRFLLHARRNILTETGFLYIEVPNLYGIPLCDPTHFFTYSHSSLENLLKVSGFKVIYLTTGGDPVDETFFARSDEENLICLAVPDNTNFPFTAKKINGDLFQKQLTKSYRKHSTKAVLRYILEIKRHIFRCLVYLIFIIFIEPFSTKLSLKLAKQIGLRRDKS